MYVTTNISAILLYFSLVEVRIFFVKYKLNGTCIYKKIFSLSTISTFFYLIVFDIVSLYYYLIIILLLPVYLEKNVEMIIYIYLFFFTSQYSITSRMYFFILFK